MTILTRLALLAGMLLPSAAQALPDTYYAGVVQHPATNIPPVQVVARHEIPLMSGGINDFSGIATRDGVNVLLLSDHGFIAVTRLHRGYGQQIDGIEVRQVALLRDAAGQALHGPRHDAEGLSLAPDGSIYVAFEEYNRVVHYATLGGPAENLGAHRDFSRLRLGRGLESVAVSRDGALYSVPEEAARMTYGFPSYRLQGGEWTGSFRLPMDGAFLPVGADFGPDGLLYVLEREENTRGFRSQVRRFAIRGRAISEPQVVMRSDYGQFGNLEGLAVFRDRSGRIRLLTVSDDDLRRNPSELVDLVLNR